MIHLSKPTNARGWAGHWEFDVRVAQDPETPTQAYTYFTSTDATDADDIVDVGSDVCTEIDFDSPTLEQDVAAKLIVFPEWTNATATYV